MKFSWGKGIAFAYILFAVITLSFVAFTMSKKVDLVDNNYYDKEIRYQEQIDKMNNSKRLTENIKVERVKNAINIFFPKEFLGKVSGDIIFYKPSDKGKDFKINISCNPENYQTIDVSKLEKGFWKISIDWSADKKNYYYEQQIIL